MALTVRIAEAKDHQRYDGYVHGHEEGSFCHLFGWRYILSCGIRQRPAHLVAESAGRIVGVMPLSLRDSRLFGKAALSTQLAVYGGPLADSEAIRDRLLETAWQHARDFGSRTLEIRLRGQMQIPDIKGGAWHWEEGRAATFIKDIGATDAEILAGIRRKKKRALVRKSVEHGMTIEPVAMMDVYPVYAESVHRLGTPVFPRAMFRTLAEVFGDISQGFLVRRADGRVVSGAILFAFGQTVTPYYAARNQLADDLPAHDFMYFSLMKYARDMWGSSRFDFGRSKVDTGPYHYKKNWGFEPNPLYTLYGLVDGEKIPDLSPQNPKYGRMARLWKRLPLPVASRIGPYLARHLG